MFAPIGSLIKEKRSPNLFKIYRMGVKCMHFPFSGLEANPIWIIVWGVVTGYVFSTIGAAGAVLTMVGQTLLFKLDAAMVKTFVAGGMDEAAASKAAAGSVKVHNLMAVILSPIIAVPRYMKERRVAIPLALCVGAGIVIGALIGPAIPMSLAAYKFWFGVMTFIIGCRLFYETTERYQQGKKKLAAVNKAFQEKMAEVKKTKNWDEFAAQGFAMNKFTIGEMKFTFWGQEFVVSPIVAALGGFFIAIIGSMFGLGGGFMLVPFLSSVFVLPMFIVSSTSITVVLINSLVGAAGYLARGAIIDWLYMGFFLAGVFGGSLLGPISQKYYKEKYLRLFLAIILFLLGLRYMGVFKMIGINL